MSMANGIECRAPLLSNKIFKVSQKISYDQKVAGGSKHLLRLLHAQKFPKNSNLKKKGFSVSRLVFKDEKVIAWLKHFCEIHQTVNDEIVSSLFVHIENLNNNKLAKVDINDVWKNIVLLNWLKANNVSL
jgi:asparagine synthetase B (glutamine-hydrolysing)